MRFAGQLNIFSPMSDALVISDSYDLVLATAYEDVAVFLVMLTDVKVVTFFFR
jgi:hypothetical protein